MSVDTFSGDSFSGRLGRKAVLVFIDVMLSAYRAFGSLWLSGSCRFEPSCSVYAQQAIERHGIWNGGKLAAMRLWKCRPGGPFGEDPVPKTVVCDHGRG